MGLDDFSEWGDVSRIKCVYESSGECSRASSDRLRQNNSFAELLLPGNKRSPFSMQAGALDLGYRRASRRISSPTEQMGYSERYLMALA
jgi:hypothetical protein